MDTGVCAEAVQPSHASHQGKYGDLDSTLVSYGPCQTPTLGFCVDRHDDIQTFQPESYWQLIARVNKGAGIQLRWDRGRVFDVEVREQ